MEKEDNQTYDPCAHPEDDGELQLYNGAGGTIMATLRKGDEGLPIEEYLPESGKGEKFGDFAIKNYFNFAKVWLATSEQWSRFHAAVKKKNMPQGTIFTMPPIDLVSYQLIDQQNNVDYTKVKQLFSLTGALWEECSNLSPICGLIPKLLGEGLSINEIKQSIKTLAQKGDIDADGKLNLDKLHSDDRFQILSTVADSYNQFHHLPADTVSDEAATLWRRSTRSLSPTDPRFNDAASITMDLLTLKILNKKGGINLEQVKAIANFIWQLNGARPSFNKTVTFVRKRTRKQK